MYKYYNLFIKNIIGTATIIAIRGGANILLEPEPLSSFIEDGAASVGAASVAPLSSLPSVSGVISVVARTSAGLSSVVLPSVVLSVVALPSVDAAALPLPLAAPLPLAGAAAPLPLAAAALASAVCDRVIL